MGSNDRGSLEWSASKHEHGWKPNSTLYSSAAAPVLSSSPVMRSGSTTSTRASTSTAAGSGQVERTSDEERRKKLNHNRNRRWTEQRNRQRNRHKRAIGSATEGLVEADEDTNSVRLTDIDLKTAGLNRRDGSPTVQADPEDSKTSPIEPFRETLTMHAKQSSPMSTDKYDGAQEGPTISSLSAYLQGRMRLDPGAYEGGYYRHPVRHW